MSLKPPTCCEEVVDPNKIMLREFNSLAALVELEEALW
jgi:hypothetical protein